MLLAIDIGNTNIVLGVFDGDELVADWRLSTRTSRTADEFLLQVKDLFDLQELSLSDIDGIVVASVVPTLVDSVVTMCQQYFRRRPMIIGPGVRTGVAIEYEDPREVGADRVVNAAAALVRYGTPCIIVDFGTATTIDAIDANGAYLGGAIAPGITIASEALFQYAAKLPRVELLAPGEAIGRNTITSMQSGIVYGYAGLVKELVGRFREELGGRAAVIATGGQSALIAPHTGMIDHVDPLLTLWGLREIYRRNT
jgi:type III pantothenate kinase